MGTPVEFWKREDFEHILSSLRVDQMKNDFEDIDASHLLDEKQTDLELAAKIGKTLLDRNAVLEQRLQDAEEQLAASMDAVNQLRHTINVKDNLLHLYSRDAELPDDSDVHNSKSTSPHPDCTGNDETRDHNVSALLKKLYDMEKENALLHQELSVVATNSLGLGDRESSSVHDFLNRFAEANVHIRQLSEDLLRKSDAYLHQQNEMTRIVSKCGELNNRLSQANSCTEHMDSQLQSISLENQTLAADLRDVRDKYDESISLFTTARAEVRALRKRMRGAGLRPTCLYYTPFHTPTITNDVGAPTSTASPLRGSANNEEHSSVAAELAQSARNDSAGENRLRLFRMMEQVRVVRSTQPSSNHQDVTASGNLPSDTDSLAEDPTVSSSGFVSGSEACDAYRLVESHKHRRRAAVLADCRRSDLARGISLHDSFDEDDLLDNREMLLEVDELPVDKASCLGEQQKQPSTVNFDSSTPVGVISRPSLLDFDSPSREMVSAALTTKSWVGGLNDSSQETDGALLHAAGGASVDDSVLPRPGLMSSNPGAVYCYSYYRSPQRLQLVKPLLGSGMLHRWQRLATPSLTSVLYEGPLPGVCSRGAAGTCATEATVFAPQAQGSSTVPSSLTTLLSDDVTATIMRGSSKCQWSQFRRSSAQESSTGAHAKLINDKEGRTLPPTALMPASVLKHVQLLGIRPGPTEKQHVANTGSLLSEYLVHHRLHQRELGRCISTTSEVSGDMEAKFDQIRPRSPSSVTTAPPHTDDSRRIPRSLSPIRSSSPSCRGLLDVSDLAVEQATRNITHPASSSVGLPDTVGMRYQKSHRASSGLRSVKEESS